MYNAKSLTCDWPENVECDDVRRAFLDTGIDNQGPEDNLGDREQLDNTLKPTFYQSG